MYKTCSPLYDRQMDDMAWAAIDDVVAVCEADGNVNLGKVVGVERWPDGSPAAYLVAVAGRLVSAEPDHVWAATLPSLAASRAISRRGAAS